jgi:enamine deaminase RidA (YjgF/YER057c/UK114 family)
MTPTAVNPDALPAPRGYSHGTLAGNTLYLGGQTALDADMNIVPGASSNSSGRRSATCSRRCARSAGSPRTW